MQTKQCCLLATGSVTAINEVYLVVERQILCAITKATQEVAVLLASFHAFHVNYPISTTCLFQFLEVCFLKVKVSRKPRLQRFIAKLSININIHACVRTIKVTPTHPASSPFPQELQQRCLSAPPPRFSAGGILGFGALLSSYQT